MSGPSKESLRAQARALAQELGGAELPADLDTMKQEPLLKLVAELSAALEARSDSSSQDESEPLEQIDEPEPEPEPESESESEPESESESEPEPEPEPEAPPARPAYATTVQPKAKPTPVGPAPARCRVCEGKLVVCLKGPLGAFEHIRDFDLAGGQAELDELFAAGVIEEAKR